MTSLTFARLIAIERALRFRLTTPNPPLKDGIDHYERALDWAKEQRIKRTKVDVQSEPMAAVAPLSPQKPTPKAIPPPETRSDYRRRA